MSQKIMVSGNADRLLKLADDLREAVTIAREKHTDPDRHLNVELTVEAQDADNIDRPVALVFDNDDMEGRDDLPAGTLLVTVDTR